jgi:membrane protease YdiL (CAAX protease family)
MSTRTAAVGGVAWRSAAAGLAARPDRDTVVAFVSYLAVVGTIFLAFQVFTTDRVAANFITYGIVGLAGLGVAFPVLYTVLVRRKPLADLGLTTRYLVPSLLLGAVLGWDTWRNTVATLEGAMSVAAVPLMTMALVVGLFEAVFFRGWLLLRFEAAFGLVPGLLLSALCYSAYHVAYGMSTGEMLYLLGFGIVFGAMFRLTRNVLVLWPLYTPMGGFYTTFKDGLVLPFEATYGFVVVLALMGAAVAAGSIVQRRQEALSSSKDPGET